MTGIRIIIQLANDGTVSVHKSGKQQIFTSYAEARFHAEKLRDGAQGLAEFIDLVPLDRRGHA